MLKPVASSALLAFLTVCLPHPAAAQLSTEMVADGFTRPVAIVPDPLAPGRLFVAEHRGLVWVVQNGVKLAAPFLDVTAEVQNDGVEQGFLGMTFHPAGDRVFVAFSKKRTPDSPSDAVGDTVLRRYRRSADPLVLDSTTAKDVLVILQIRPMHKGGDLHFLTDHLGRTYLYMSVGDGGAFADPVGNAQDPQSLRGKMLRLDVDVPDDHPQGYAVPPDNPFVGGRPIPALGEIWAFGYRNPWRFSFDDFGDGRTGAMIVGDVGEFSREEIDYEPYGRSGRNYGWFIREGTIPGVAGTPAFTPLTDPLADYPRDIGRSVTGGYVYRGSALPAAFRGRYFVADFFGRVFSLGLSIASGGEARVAEYIDHTAELGNPRLIPTFGRDLSGELYFATFGGGAGGSARVLKIVAVPEAPPSPPLNLTSQIAGSTVLLEWQRGTGGGSPQSYQIEAGSRSGLADLLVTQTSLASMVAHSVPDGLYYVRVRSLNPYGLSGPSNEIQVRVGCTGPPSAPTGLTASVETGGFVSVAWNPVAGVTAYVLEAGSEPGLANVANIPIATNGLAGVVSPGTYYARVKAVNGCGTSLASDEIEVVVPPPV